jgi:hypothetical protein
MTYDYQEIASEQQLFAFIKKNFIQDLNPTKFTNSRYDCYSSEYNLDIELKCRRKHYDELIIERKKYVSLMERSKTYGTIPVYINSTPKGVWGFYLQQYEVEWSRRDLPKQTDFSDRQTISKEVGYLKVSEGVDLILLLSSSFP